MMAHWILAAAIGAMTAGADAVPTPETGKATATSATGAAKSPVPATAKSEAPPQSLAESLRHGKALAEAARTALRRAKPTESADIQAHARELLGLFREVQRDASLAPSVRRSLQSQLRSRLLSLADQIDRRAAGLRRQARQPTGRPASEAAQALPAAEPIAASVAKKRETVLAQQPPPGGFGGPTGRPRDDYGEDLAQLIREVVAPATWDTAGGNAAIRYWRPGRALIISQTNENHDDIADLLEQLDRMSR